MTIPAALTGRVVDLYRATGMTGVILTMLVVLVASLPLGETVEMSLTEGIHVAFLYRGPDVGNHHGSRDCPLRGGTRLAKRKMRRERELVNRLIDECWGSVRGVGGAQPAARIIEAEIEAEAAKRRSRAA